VPSTLRNRREISSLRLQLFRTAIGVLGAQISASVSPQAQHGAIA